MTTTSNDDDKIKKIEHMEKTMRHGLISRRRSSEPGWLYPWQREFLGQIDVWKKICVKVPTGQGKSWLMIGAAMYLMMSDIADSIKIKSEEALFRKVLVICHNGGITSQMFNQVIMFSDMCHRKVKITVTKKYSGKIEQHVLYGDESETQYGIHFDIMTAGYVKKEEEYDVTIVDEVDSIPKDSVRKLLKKEETRVWLNGTTANISDFKSNALHLITDGSCVTFPANMQMEVAPISSLHEVLETLSDPTHHVCMIALHGRPSRGDVRDVIRAVDLQCPRRKKYYSLPNGEKRRTEQTEMNEFIMSLVPDDAENAPKVCPPPSVIFTSTGRLGRALSVDSLSLVILLTYNPNGLDLSEIIHTMGRTTRETDSRTGRGILIGENVDTRLKSLGIKKYFTPFSA